MGEPWRDAERADAILADAEETMRREQVRHLPVVDGDLLVGIVSQRDVLAASPSSLSVPSEEDELEYEKLWRRVGLSVDWSDVYRTISETSRATAQRMFLHNLARGEAYAQEAGVDPGTPQTTLWELHDVIKP